MFDTAQRRCRADRRRIACRRGRGRSYRRFQHGPAAFKLDLAVAGRHPVDGAGVPAAGTVHLGGTCRPRSRAPKPTIGRGVMPDRPFVLVGQQYLADPTRSRGDVAPGVGIRACAARLSAVTPASAILDQIERFAPGFRERIVGLHTMSPADYQAYNPNYVGGDIATGANTVRQLIARPRLARRSVRDRDSRRVPVLGGDAAGRGCARDVRQPGRASRAALPAG